MVKPFPPPSRVRCNRGFGWSFWVLSGTTVVVSLCAAAASRGEGSLGGWYGLVIGAPTLALFIVVRAALPRLEFDVAGKFIRTRRRDVPYAAIGEVKFADETRAGTWAVFIDDDGKRLARMSIAGTMFAATNVEQWAALRHALYSAASGRGTRTAQPRTASKSWKSLDEALQVLDAQVAWCQTENRPDATDAPWRGLMNTSVIVR